MNRIERTFKQSQPFIGFITGGDGGIDYSVDCALAQIAGGVNILEIAFPFSDPIADGPVIQRSHQRALEQGTTASSILEIAKRLRRHTDVPLVLFSYFNPLLQKGLPFLRQVKSAGFDAVLVVDWAIPESSHGESAASDPFLKELDEADLLPILLAAPSTSEERLSKIQKFAKGFLYYVTQKGTTGVRSKQADDLSSQLSLLRKYFRIPIVAGFGIADRAAAKAAIDVADGFVVGSAFVKLMENRVDPVELTKLAQAIYPR